MKTTKVDGRFFDSSGNAVEDELHGERRHHPGDVITMRREIKRGRWRT